jgi:serine protease Do
VSRRAALLGLLTLTCMVTLMDVVRAEARPWSWLGVRIRDLSEQEMEEIASRHGMREGFGVVVVEVMDDTPAAKAGVKAGDIVVALDERPVTDTRVLQQTIAAAPSEREVRLTVLRPEGRRPLKVRLTAMPRGVVGERVAAEFGFVIREADAPPDLRGPASTAPTVTVVLRGSPAEKAGLEVGDVILQVGEQAVMSRDAARETLSDAPTDRPLRLTVRRRGRPLSLEVPAISPP